jgi:3-oxoacyl-[acyl-carrier protein] reductase
MFDLKGRTALVTGGAGALGLAVGRALQGRGAGVVLADLSEERVSLAARQLSEGPVLGISLDVTDEASIADAVRGIVSELGSLDIAVMAAGYGEVTPVSEMSYPSWRRMLHVHADGTFLVIHHTLPLMLAQGWGRQIAFSSIAAAQGVAGQAHYAAAKGAIESLVRSVSREVAGRGITVNAIAPGYFESPLNDGASVERLRALRAAVPCGRFGDPQEIGALAVYLASPEAAYHTGQILTLAGGFTFCTHTGD